MISGMLIGLLSPEKIREMSFGEITVAKTLEAGGEIPVPNGLMCQKIFGPVRRGVCYCGKTPLKNSTCPFCKVSMVDPSSRRTRMGHIELAVPIVHIWYRLVIGILLELSPKRVNDMTECKIFRIENKGKSEHKKGDFVPYVDFLRYISENPEDMKFSGITGGMLIETLLKELDLNSLYAKLRKAAPSRRKNHRLPIIRAFIRSGIKPEWMLLRALPVLPPGLRPILIMEDGTIATSDLNELYEKIIHRNKKVKTLYALKAPILMINTARRLLQDAVDSLIKNGKRSKGKNRSGKRLLKCLSQMVEGKEGTIRRNLLGKRVDYSARSVIVSGPELKLDQCGLPVTLALDMYKPLIYGRLLRIGYATSLAHARVLVDRRRPETIDALEHVMKDTVVLINRAPSLHKMSMQAFNPTLVFCDAIRLHPSVCSSFNADFDGDQMGVHLPITREAQKEAHELMLSTNNLLSPASGKLAVAPAQDIVLGIYCLTRETAGAHGEGKLFADAEDLLIALEHNFVDVHAKVKVRMDGTFVETTAGRILLASQFPSRMPFGGMNKRVKKKDIAKLIEQCLETFGKDETVKLIDKIKSLGFEWATKTGASISTSDITVPKGKWEIIQTAQEEVDEIKQFFRMGEMTEKERYNNTVATWKKATEEVADLTMKQLGVEADGLTEEEKQKARDANSIYLMAESGARGSKDQISQVAGMRGLMAKPNGGIVEVPIKANFKEGLSYHEYLLSCHGARKGRADGALKTKNAGYFTRKLVDVGHDIIINEKDCGSVKGLLMTALMSGDDVAIPSGREDYRQSCTEGNTPPRDRRASM